MKRKLLQLAPEVLARIAANFSIHRQTHAENATRLADYLHQYRLDLQRPGCPLSATAGTEPSQAYGHNRMTRNANKRPDHENTDFLP